MSSTKITEFDLDPNMDMAHESTAQEILSKVANGVKVDFRSPIALTTASVAETGDTFSIEGKGKVFLLMTSTQSKVSITVDGVEICSEVNISRDSGFEIEFSESINITMTFHYSGGLDIIALLY